MPSPSDRRLSSAFVFGALALCLGCNDPASGSGGAGGSNSQGGAGGKGGSGGSQGGSGGQAGSGGTPGTGGTGTGGTGTGGSAGTGGAGTGGSAGTGGGGAGGSPGPDGGGGDGGSPEDFLTQCFSGLRPLAPRSQTASKRSSNSAYHLRLAIEVPPDSIGTSGTQPWKAVRVGIVTPQARVCIKEEAALVAAYKGSHHNCADVLTVTAGGLIFTIKPPDTDPARATTTLTITGEGGTPAVTLPTVSCTGTNNAACKSGGPCQ